jgi:hypothetical protein
MFYKGRTTNHLTWVGVDATDFATPESALSAATKIKIYGKLRANDTVQFVSSGTGSLTNDIKHVGASVLGIYTIGLVKADLSDASAAWYDQYIVSLSATGAAFQTLVVDGGIDQSAISAYQSRLSDMASYLVAMSGMLSDTHSAAILGASNASEAQSHATLAASRILLVQSRLSDFQSAVYASDISNIIAGIGVGNSRTLLVQSRLSDFTSAVYPSDFSVLQAHLVYISGVVSDMSSRIATTGVSLTAETLSDIRSAIAAGPAATITASDISAIAAAVWDEDYTIAGNNASSSFGSAFRVNTSRISDVQSYLVVMSGALSDVYSLASNINSATLNSPDLSDIASAVWAELYTNHTTASTFGSALRLTMSRVSDTQSYLVGMSGMLSDTYSAANAASPTASDIASVVWTNAPGAAVSSRVLRILSDTSQINSALGVISGIQSDIYSLLSDLHSDVTIVSGIQSDIYSLLSDLHSDVTIISDVVSNIYSNILAPNASFLSDVASAVWATAGADPTAVPAVTASMKAKMDWITAVSRNKITQTSTVQSLRNDGDSADIASAAVSDDATTFTRNKFA